VIATTQTPTIAVFTSHVVYGVWWKRNDAFAQVGLCLPNQYGVTEVS
jgi:hypothetical protein